MRKFGSFVLGLFALSPAFANAADVKLGNVIAVKRTIQPSLSGCLEKLTRNNPSGYFTCEMYDPRTPDQTIYTGSSVQYSGPSCNFRLYFNKGSYEVVVYGDTPADTLSADEAAACVRKGFERALFNGAPTLDTIVYTIE